MEVASPYLVTAILTVALAQLCRLVRNWVTTKQLEPQDLRVNHGVVTTHVVLIAAIAMSALVVEGWDSTAFGLSAAYAAVVVMMTSSLSTKDVNPQIGHSIMLGVVAALIINTGYWLDDVTTWTQNPEGSSYLQQRLVVIFGVLVLSASVFISWTKFSKVHELPTSRRLARALRISVVFPGVLALLSLAMLNSNVPGFTNLVWSLVAAIWIVLANIYYRNIYRTAPERLKQEALHFRGKPGTRISDKPKARPAKKKPVAAKTKKATPKKKKARAPAKKKR